MQPYAADQVKGITLGSGEAYNNNIAKFREYARLSARVDQKAHTRIYNSSECQLSFLSSDRVASRFVCAHVFRAVAEHFRSVRILFVTDRDRGWTPLSLSGGIQIDRPVNVNQV